MTEDAGDLLERIGEEVGVPGFSGELPKDPPEQCFLYFAVGGIELAALDGTDVTEVLNLDVRVKVSGATPTKDARSAAARQTRECARKLGRALFATGRVEEFAPVADRFFADQTEFGVYSRVVSARITAT